jgi:hypothetical protein
VAIGIGLDDREYPGATGAGADDVEVVTEG